MDVATVLFEDGIIEVFSDEKWAEHRLNDLGFEQKQGAIWEDGGGIQAQVTLGVKVQNGVKKERDRTLKVHAQKGQGTLCNTQSKRVTDKAGDVTCGTCQRLLQT
jgi:hypothetical protein